MWKDDIDAGNREIFDDFDGALNMYCHAVENAKEEELPSIQDAVCDSILDVVSSKDVPSDSMECFRDLSLMFYDRSYGDVFPLEDMLNRSTAFIEPGNAFILTSNMLKLSSLALYACTDPEEFGFVFDCLGSLILTARDSSPGDDRITLIESSFFPLRDRFNECARKLDDDQFCELLDCLEADESKMSNVALEEYFSSFQDGVVKAGQGDHDELLDRFFEIFYESVLDV